MGTEEVSSVPVAAVQSLSQALMDDGGNNKEDGPMGTEEASAVLVAAVQSLS